MIVIGGIVTIGTAMGAIATVGVSTGTGETVIAISIVGGRFKVIHGAQAGATQREPAIPACGGK